MERYFRYGIGDDYIKHINNLLCVVTLLIGIYCINSLNSSKKVNNVMKNINIIENDSIKTSIDNIYDSVYVIEAYTILGGTSTGSGFVYKKDNKYGYIITNYHVVKDSDSIVVIDSDNNENTAKLLGYDEQTDLAVLCIDSKKVRLVATIGKSKVNIGDTVFTIGAPGGIKYKGTVTKGIISGLNREIEISVNNEEYIMNVIQTDAAINPGNSGGPLVNIKGEVIGINSLKIVQDEIEGMGFAIPIEEVLIYTDRLEKGKKIERPYLGFDLVDTNDGVQIKNKSINSIKCDLEINDIIVEIDNEEVKDKIHFRYLLYKHNIHDTINIKYKRNGKKYNTKVIL